MQGEEIKRKENNNGVLDAQINPKGMGFKNYGKIPY